MTLKVYTSVLDDEIDDAGIKLKFRVSATYRGQLAI